MRAWNRKHKPKHWTKPKWHKRIFIFKTFYILKTAFIKEKINICLFNKIRGEINGLEM